MEPRTYAEAGVNVEQAEGFVERLKLMSKRPGHSKLWKAAGGYAAVYPITESIGVACTTDGVGTKLLVAHELKKYDSIGIDLVAMCANDLICVGARPTSFLDYFAIGKLDDQMCDQILKGIVEGCDQADMILAGGETAEMPGLYQPGHYDLAGFAIGTVSKEHLITGEKIKPGQNVIGVASSGIHSNGFSLARKVIERSSKHYEELLKPTLIYVKPVNEVLEQLRTVTGLVHVTGGGWRNLFRLNDKVGFNIESPLPVPAVLQEVGKHVAQEEMYKTFNMGMGLVLIVDGDTGPIVEIFKKHGFSAAQVGTTTDRVLTLTVKGMPWELKD
jgi:phosphoribosylformylglycinamidine cyclo-ligase